MFSSIKTFCAQKQGVPQGKMPVKRRRLASLPGSPTSNEKGECQRRLSTSARVPSMNSDESIPSPSDSLDFRPISCPAKPCKPLIVRRPFIDGVKSQPRPLSLMLLIFVIGCACGEQSSNFLTNDLLTSNFYEIIPNERHKNTIHSNVSFISCIHKACL